MEDDSSDDDSDSIIEENSEEEEATTPVASTMKTIDDVHIVVEQPKNGFINHNNKMKKKLSILSKAGMFVVFYDVQTLHR